MTISAHITNFGQSRSFPTCLGNIFIARGQTIKIEGRKVIEELREAKVSPRLLVKPIKVEKPIKAKPRRDFSKLKINELRRLLKGKVDSSVMRSGKEVLIKELEGREE